MTDLKQAEPTQWRDMVVVSLVREGINKHRARELADHFAAQPEPVRMPKIGDKVICIEDESLGEVVSLTAGGSPDVTFDDGSRGTYVLREFAELFGYVNAAQQEPVACRFCHSKKGCWTWQCYSCGEIDDVQKPPPAAQRPWVGLTDEDIHMVLGKAYTLQASFFAKSIEAKLKERNT
jgi:hypothetical protein